MEVPSPFFAKINVLSAIQNESQGEKKIKALNHKGWNVFNPFFITKWNRTMT
jgi:hypothetical protein